MWKFLVAEDVLQNSAVIRVHVSSVAKWVTGLGEPELSDFFSGALIITFQRMPESCCAVSLPFSFCHVHLTLSCLALPDVTALLVMAL